ncbi:Putative transcription factor, MBF1 like protein [Amycolatopsis japonica]|uniref:Putative transcription factor, MBF1 like protein n=1 Tax=Amycolatopsis japonica TaxID=208439 RepID=A0A075USZ4_9PSEU|nr:helix-turn-helix transcriptional regulator [Amycolatopsis japonica]AIG73305.1 Putative transcription factor, MBF1 like protein [Amycolatopsis japonica]
MGMQRKAFAARREALGFTQETFAQQLKVELSTVGRWERGTLTPHAWRRPRIAELLQVSLDELAALLNPSVAKLVVRQPSSTQREVMVDAVLVAGGAAIDVLGRRGEESLCRRMDRAGVSARVADLHRRYQAARYADAARRLPSVREAVDALIDNGLALRRQEGLRLRCSVEIVAAKLATKAGDGEAGLAAAELARVAAEEAEDIFGVAAAAYQRACALLRSSSTEGVARINDAEKLAVSAATALRGQDPQSVTWRGALTLIGSVIAARRADHGEADERLKHADELAQRLGVDGNIGWTAFGPSNVLIHRTSVAVALDDPHRALATAEQLDITGLPTGLNGRQAQFHLDNAWAHTQLAEDPQAVIHLLETERVAPELVRTNPNARSLIADLLSRERRQEVPALRGLALRAGVAV